MKIGKINLGRSTKKYTHDLSHDVNTTASWGNVQPLLCQYLSPSDSLSLSVKQLLRLAPMPTPTHARIGVHNRAMFVPISDIHKGFEALISEQMIKTSSLDYIPKSVPFTTSAYLVYSMLKKSHASYYVVDSSQSTNPIINRSGIERIEGTLKPWNRGTDGPEKNAFDAYESDVNSLGVTTNHLDVHGTFSNGTFSIPFFHSGEVNVDNADYIHISPDYYKNNVKKGNVICFKLTNRMKRLHQILKSLGYSLSMFDVTPVSILPLLAFYKAYFDAYMPVRSKNWHSTNAYKLIDLIYEKDETDFSSRASDTMLIFENFLDDLSNCYATETIDYMTAHTYDMTNVPDTEIENTHPSSMLNTIRASKGLPHLDAFTVSNMGLNNISLQLLQRLTRFVNKNSIIGKRVEEYVRVHYGAEYVSTLFEEAKELGSFITNADISDVISQSDTANSGVGEYLGAYAGRGIGFSDGKMSYTANTFGYFIILTSVLPKSGISQGNDPSLYALDRYTIPSADFDSLGYELSPLSNFYDDNGIGTIKRDDIDQWRLAFGYIPRFSGFKAKKNIVSGSFALRSLRSNYEPYHLDKRFVNDEILFDSSSKKIVFFHTRPSATSEELRFLGKYPSFGFFNRIFYNQDQVVQSERLTPEPYSEDNFIIQNTLDLRVTNELKPIRESYDVYQGDVDNSTTSVTQS